MNFSFLKLVNSKPKIDFTSQNISFYLRNHGIEQYFIDIVLAEIEKKTLKTNEEIFEVLKSEFDKYLSKLIGNFLIDDSISPNIIAVLGLNGSGKTTTSFKMANLLNGLNWKVSVLGCDIVRPGAAFQFQELKNLSGNFRTKLKNENQDIIDFVESEINFAKKNKLDIVILDLPGITIGNVDTLEYISSVVRMAKKMTSKGGFSSIFIADSNIQNEFLSQITFVQSELKIDSFFLSKLETTRKIGKILSVTREMGIKISGIGTGIEIEDISSARIDFLSDYVVNFNELLKSCK